MDYFLIDAAMLRFYGALDLNAMTMEQYLELHDRIADVAEAEAGQTDHAAKVRRTWRRRERARRWA